MMSASAPITRRGASVRPPARLAPGYAPAYPTTNKVPAKKQPVFAHAHTAQHVTPWCRSGSDRAPIVEYFEEHDET
jgi:hypothetical protein